MSFLYIYLRAAKKSKIVIYSKLRLVSQWLYNQFILWCSSSSQLHQSDRFVPIVSCWMCILFHRPPQSVRRGRDWWAPSASVRSADPVQGLLPTALHCERSYSQREYSQDRDHCDTDCGQWSSSVIQYHKIPVWYSFSIWITICGMFPVSV